MVLKCFQSFIAFMWLKKILTDSVFFSQLYLMHAVIIGANFGLTHVSDVLKI